MLGSFARVKLTKNIRNEKYYAAKIVKKAEIIKMQQVEHIANEIRVLTYVDHPFIVKIINNID